MSFYSLADGACQPELYGIENNALAIQIHNKEDYFNSTGALATELQVSVPNRNVAGTIELTETSSGLDGAIVWANDPRELLKPLIETTYRLSRASEEWVPLVSGTWGPGCTNVNDLEFTCAKLHFDDAVSGKASFYGGGFTSDPTDDKDEIPMGGPVNWMDVSFALRHLIKKGDAEFEMYMVMFTTRGGLLEGHPLFLLVSGDKMLISDKPDREDGFFIQLEPAVD